MSTPSKSESTTALFKKAGGKKTKKKAAAGGGGFGAALKGFQMSAFPYAGEVRPGNQTPQRVVMEEGIVKPDYANDGIVSSDDAVLRAHATWCVRFLPVLLVSAHTLFLCSVVAQK